MNALRFLSLRECGPVRPSGETDFDGGDLGCGNGCGAGNSVTAVAAFDRIAGALSLLFSGSCVLG